jgi:hypothetical protein
VLPLRDFSLLNQIDGPSAPSLIDDRNLLRVFEPFPLLFSFGVLDLVPLAFGTSAFGILKSQQTQISGVNPFGVSYPLTPILLDPMLSNQSESLSSTCPLANRRFMFLPSGSMALNASGFGIFPNTTSQKPQSTILRSPRSGDTCPI